MKKLKPLHLGIFVAVFLAITGVLLYHFKTQASIPQRMNYQGKLLDSTGTPVPDGNYSMRFSIWDALSGGTEEWNETQTVAVTNGLFHAELGAVTAINLAFTKDYWLEIKVGTDPAMTPRQRITSTGYAYNSVRAGDLEVKYTGADEHVVQTTPDGKIYGTKFVDAGSSTFYADPGGESNLKTLKLSNLEVKNVFAGYPAGVKILGGGWPEDKGMCLDHDDDCTLPDPGKIQAVQYLTGSTDLAELYPSEESLVTGEVVIINPNRDGEITKSKTPYNPTVLGVISSKPSMLLGNDTDNPSSGYPVALSGRVKVKVTDEGGSIKPGDFLTTSSKEDYVQKATKSGPVLGLALEFFDGQEGEVIVFVDMDRYVEVK